jgi:fructose-specific phosphotransferase system component IIB
MIDPVDVLHRRLVSHPRKGAPKDALSSAVRTRAEMWTSLLAESVGDGAADAVVVALDMSTPQARRRKETVSIEINDEWTTPTRSLVNMLADMSPQYQNRNTEMQRHYCTKLCLR